MQLSIKRYAHILLLLLLSQALIAEHAAAKEISFSFAPQDGTTFIQKASITREKQTGTAELQRDESFSETKIICKKTVDGWDIIAHPIKAVMKRNGQEIKNPVLDWLSKLTITYKLDHQGELKDITGYENLWDALKSQFPLDVAQKIASTLNADALKKKETAEWNGRIGDYLHKEAALGETWEYAVPFSLPNGESLNYRVQTHFKDYAQCGKTQCILIEQTFDSSAEAMAGYLQEVAGALAQGQKDSQKFMPKLSEQGASIKGSVTRLIDPATMNIYKEEIERVIQIEMDIPGQGITPTKMTEKRSYDYEYLN